MRPDPSDQISIFLSDMREMPEIHTDPAASSGTKRQSALARRLLASALASGLGRAPSAGELAEETRTSEGKPYLPAFPDFHYNISHSGSFVVCASGSKPLGIDIQAIPEDAERALKIARHFFSDEEKQALIDPQNSGAPRGAYDASRICLLFTRLWTTRESYIKLTGRGLAEPFEGFRPDLHAGRIIAQNGADAFLYECAAPEGYCMSVCSFFPISKIKIQKVDP